MKVTGLGTPESVRARFRTAEVDVLVDVLRERRAQATREAATAHETVSTSVRSVDDRHDRLRAVEACSCNSMTSRTHVKAWCCSATPR